ncbi:hypothetical protein FRC20_002852, partial [Serendipita sp. 405]
TPAAVEQIHVSFRIRLQRASWFRVVSMYVAGMWSSSIQEAKRGGASDVSLSLQTLCLSEL